MYTPYIASYDPIFYLHHTNVDRLYQTWLDMYDKDGQAKKEFEKN